MDFAQACKLINEAYVLTETEKSSFIALVRDDNATLIKILKDYQASGDSKLFYDALRKNELLTNQKFFTVSFWPENYNNLRSRLPAKGSPRSLSRTTTRSPSCSPAIRSCSSSSNAFL